MRGGSRGIGSGRSAAHPLPSGPHSRSSRSCILRKVWPRAAEPKRMMRFGWTTVTIRRTGSSIIGSRAAFGSGIVCLVVQSAGGLLNVSCPVGKPVMVASWRILCDPRDVCLPSLRVGPGGSASSTMRSCGSNGAGGEYGQLQGCRKTGSPPARGGGLVGAAPAPPPAGAGLSAGDARRCARRSRGAYVETFL